ARVPMVLVPFRARVPPARVTVSRLLGALARVRDPEPPLYRVPAVIAPPVNVKLFADSTTTPAVAFVVPVPPGATFPGVVPVPRKTVPPGLVAPNTARPPSAHGPFVGPAWKFASVVFHFPV